MQRENYSVDLWIEVSQLRMALQAWRVELGKLDGCVEVFEGLLVGQKEGVVGDDERGAGTGTGRGMGKHKRQDSGVDVEFEEERDDKKICWRASAVEAGRRMRKRLGDIMREYDQKIGECTMVLDGMALSAQLVSLVSFRHSLYIILHRVLILDQQSWSQIGYQDTQANLKIANDTRQDSSRMRSIAVLTMFFLPGTFIAVCHYLPPAPNQSKADRMCSHCSPPPFSISTPRIHQISSRRTSGCIRLSLSLLQRLSLASGSVSRRESGGWMVLLLRCVRRRLFEQRERALAICRDIGERSVGHTEDTMEESA